MVITGIAVKLDSRSALSSLASCCDYLSKNQHCLTELILSNMFVYLRNRHITLDDK